MSALFIIEFERILNFYHWKLILRTEIFHLNKKLNVNIFLSNEIAVKIKPKFNQIHLCTVMSIVVNRNTYDVNTLKLMEKCQRWSFTALWKYSNGLCINL